MRLVTSTVRQACSTTQFRGSNRTVRQARRSSLWAITGRRPRQSRRHWHAVRWSGAGVQLDLPQRLPRPHWRHGNRRLLGVTSDDRTQIFEHRAQVKKAVPQIHVDFLNSLPLPYKTQDLILRRAAFVRLKLGALDQRVRCSPSFCRFLSHHRWITVSMNLKSSTN